MRQKARRARRAFAFQLARGYEDEEGATGELRRWGIDSPQQACPGKLEIPAAQA